VNLKTAKVQIKAGPEDGLEDGQFVAYCSVFGNVDSYGDVVMAGAFTDTLADWQGAKGLLPVLWGHDTQDPFSNIGSVTEAVEDAKGLKVTAQLDLESPKAAQVYRLLKGGRVSSMSFAYDVVEGGPAKSEALGDYFELRKLKLYEVSVVPVGANDQTEILAIKAAVDALTAGVKAGRVLSTANEKALRAVHEQMMEAASQMDDVMSSMTDQEKTSTDGPVKTDEPLVGAKPTNP